MSANGGGEHLKCRLHPDVDSVGVYNVYYDGELIAREDPVCGNCRNQATPYKLVDSITGEPYVYRSKFDFPPIPGLPALRSRNG